ncbi:uncharacterized protein PODANS_6_7523 [Podospora anserina S mat+]|uniref:Podospora anserina S mat+ genomic DNA chromosome 6, supercontig 2 n=1 Tax=Podospora anserina (strain S / ATCC MYA-4624 / DSM 980 / FGSC 10383) TaxID=515849 RepID=B2B3X0_PODAN|nr:uncharacterized protein PODANS_6_7523 [Podospora anserina S mat+]CAP71806.1 unnamed protein product [Podospora anserina S mat+]CDP31197.1 Putative protein of unknown function [Podospora anserina S mat+]
MVSKIFCAIGAVLAQLAHGAVIVPIANYAVNEVEWNLPIDPNVPTGPREVVTGTVQEAIAKMEISHPGWTQNFTAGMNLTDPDTDPASSPWLPRTSASPPTAISTRASARFPLRTSSREAGTSMSLVTTARRINTATHVRLLIEPQNAEAVRWGLIG